MALTFTSEQEELRTVVRKFLAAHSDEGQVRAQMETASGYDESVWKLMAEQLGLQSIAIPEEYGGAGYGFGELAVIMEETGRALLCSPLFSTVVLASNTLMQSGDTAAAEAYLPGIAEGGTIATVALIEESGSWSEDGIQLQAMRDGDLFRISGTKPFVLDGTEADLIIVAARTDAGVSLFTVDSCDPGVGCVCSPTLDQTRRLASITFTDAPAKLLGVDGDGWEVLSRVLDIAAAALACEQVGGAAHVLESTVEYVKMRQQFGRQIGSFQAIKHKLADMLVELESARSAAYYASTAVESASPDLGGGVHRQDPLLDGVLPHCGAEHPTARRHRVHLGAPRASVLQARQRLGDAARLAGSPPGTHRPARGSVRNDNTLPRPPAVGVRAP